MQVETKFEAYYTIPDSKGKHKLFLAMLLSSHQPQAIILRTIPTVVGICGTLYCAFALIKEIYDLFAHLFITAEQSACGIAVGL